MKNLIASIAIAFAAVVGLSAASAQAATNKPPVCVKGQKDFVRWSDATLAKYGLTLICDKNFGGINLKPANSGDPTRLNGKIVRFGPHAPSFGPQTAGFSYRDGGDKLIVTTADGVAYYQKGYFGWSLSLAK